MQKLIQKGIKENAEYLHLAKHIENSYLHWNILKGILSSLFLHVLTLFSIMGQIVMGPKV